MSTRSVGARPERTIRSPSTTGPSSTGFALDLPFCASTISTILRAWSVWIAASGTSSAFAVPLLASRILPNIPGVRK